MKRVFVFLAEGYEEIEALGTTDLLRRAGVDAQLVSINYDTSIRGGHRINVICDMTADEIGNEPFDGIVLPGGMPGTVNLAKSEFVRSYIESAYSDDKVIAAICAAPSILGQMKLLQGKNYTCYPGYEKSCIGGIYSGMDAVRDDNIVTARGKEAIEQFVNCIVEALNG